MTRYLAQAEGLVGTRFVRPGDEFEYDGPAPRWATPVLDPLEKFDTETDKGLKAKPGKGKKAGVQ